MISCRHSKESFKHANYPNALVLIYPFGDFNYKGESYKTLCVIDPSRDDATVLKAITAAHVGNPNATGLINQ